MTLVGLDKERTFRDTEIWRQFFSSLGKDDAIDYKNLDESLHVGFQGVHATRQVDGRSFISPKRSSRASHPEPFRFKPRSGSTFVVHS